MTVDMQLQIAQQLMAAKLREWDARLQDAPWWELLLTGVTIGVIVVRL